MCDNVLFDTSFKDKTLLSYILLYTNSFYAITNACLRVVQRSPDVLTYILSFIDLERGRTMPLPMIISGLYVFTICKTRNMQSFS